MNIQASINQTLSLASLVASQSAAAQKIKMKKQAEAEEATHARARERKVGELTANYEEKKNIAAQGRGYKSVPDLESQLRAGEELYNIAPSTALSEENKATRQKIGKLTAAHEKALKRMEERKADETFRQEANRSAEAMRSAESERIRNLIIERGKE